MLILRLLSLQKMCHRKFDKIIALNVIFKNSLSANRLIATCFVGELSNKLFNARCAVR